METMHAGLQGDDLCDHHNMSLVGRIDNQFVADGFHSRFQLKKPFDQGTVPFTYDRTGDHGEAILADGYGNLVSL